MGIEVRAINCKSDNDIDADWQFGIPEAWSEVEAETRAKEVHEALWAKGREPDLEDFTEAMKAAGFIEINWSQGPVWDLAPGIKKRMR